MLHVFSVSTPEKSTPVISIMSICLSEMRACFGRFFWEKEYTDFNETLPLCLYMDLLAYGCRLLQDIMRVL